MELFIISWEADGVPYSVKYDNKYLIADLITAIHGSTAGVDRFEITIRKKSEPFPEVFK